MARIMARRQKQSGVAAMEFAMTLPLFLALLGATVYFGLALFTKLIVVNAANTAVRACVIQQERNYNDNDFRTCATTVFGQMVTYNNTFPGFCNGGAPVVTPQTVPAFTGTAARNTKLLVLSVTCQMPINSRVIYINGNGNGAGSTLNLQIVTSMPYILGRTN